jgi:hypothetical protein
VTGSPAARTDGHVVVESLRALGGGQTLGDWASDIQRLIISRGLVPERGEPNIATANTSVTSGVPRGG